MPFAGYRPWMARMYGCFEDADPRPLTSSPRLTWWLFGEAADIVDPLPQQGAADSDNVPHALKGMTEQQFSDGLTLILRYFLEQQQPAPANDSACDVSADARDGEEGAHMLGRVEGVTVPPPLRMHRSRWGSNPLFRGSYSYIATGATVDDIRSIAEPVVNYSSNSDDVNGSESEASLAGSGARALPATAAAIASGTACLSSLFFAGEACHERFYSATHGAYASAKREAARIAELLQASMH